MVDFKKVLDIAREGYHNRDDFPPYALASWDDRIRWTDYLCKIDNELSISPEHLRLIEAARKVYHGEIGYQNPHHPDILALRELVFHEGVSKETNAGEARSEDR